MNKVSFGGMQVGEKTNAIIDVIQNHIDLNNFKTLPNLERELTNRLVITINKIPGMSTFRAIDPGGMQNTLGCDFILCAGGMFIACECKRLTTKSVPREPERLLRTSQKIILEKCKKSGGVFLYILFIQDSVVFLVG